MQLKAEQINESFNAISQEDISNVLEIDSLDDIAHFDQEAAEVAIAALQEKVQITTALNLHEFTDSDSASFKDFINMRARGVDVHKGLQQLVLKYGWENIKEVILDSQNKLKDTKTDEILFKDFKKPSLVLKRLDALQFAQDVVTPFMSEHFIKMREMVGFPVVTLDFLKRYLDWSVESGVDVGEGYAIYDYFKQYDPYYFEEILSGINSSYISGPKRKQFLDVAEFTYEDFTKNIVVPFLKKHLSSLQKQFPDGLRAESFIQYFIAHGENRISSDPKALEIYNALNENDGWKKIHTYLQQNYPDLVWNSLEDTEISHALLFLRDHFEFFQNNYPEITMDDFQTFCSKENVKDSSRLVDAYGLLLQEYGEEGLRYAMESSVINLKTLTDDSTALKSKSNLILDYLSLYQQAESLASYLQDHIHSIKKQFPGDLRHENLEQYMQNTTPLYPNYFTNLPINFAKDNSKWDKIIKYVSQKYPGLLEGDIDNHYLIDSTVDALCADVLKDGDTEYVDWNIFSQECSQLTSFKKLFSSDAFTSNPYAVFDALKERGVLSDNFDEVVVGFEFLSSVTFNQMRSELYGANSDAIVEELARQREKSSQYFNGTWRVGDGLFVCLDDERVQSADIRSFEVLRDSSDESDVQLFSELSKGFLPEYIAALKQKDYEGIHKILSVNERDFNLQYQKFYQARMIRSGVVSKKTVSDIDLHDEQVALTSRLAVAMDKEVASELAFDQERIDVVRATLNHMIIRNNKRDVLSLYELNHESFDSQKSDIDGGIFIQPVRSEELKDVLDPESYGFEARDSISLDDFTAAALAFQNGAKIFDSFSESHQKYIQALDVTEQIWLIAYLSDVGDDESSSSKISEISHIISDFGFHGLVAFRSMEYGLENGKCVSVIANRFDLLDAKNIFLKYSEFILWSQKLSVKSKSAAEVLRNQAMDILLLASRDDTLSVSQVVETIEGISLSAEKQFVEFDSKIDKNKLLPFVIDGSSSHSDVNQQMIDQAYDLYRDNLNNREGSQELLNRFVLAMHDEDSHMYALRRTNDSDDLASFICTRAEKDGQFLFAFNANSRALGMSGYVFAQAIQRVAKDYPNEVLYGYSLVADTNKSVTQAYLNSANFRVTDVFDENGTMKFKFELQKDADMIYEKPTQLINVIEQYEKEGRLGQWYEKGYDSIEIEMCDISPQKGMLSQQDIVSVSDSVLKRTQEGKHMIRYAIKGNQAYMIFGSPISQ